MRTDHVIRFLAYVRFGSVKAAAAYLGLTESPIRHSLEILRAVYRARTTPHLVRLMWPEYGEMFTLAPAAHAIPATRRAPDQAHSQSDRGRWAA